ncbi:restriction endonuclease subunit S [Mycoplasma nasistruthionis]|uniref:restriction endonuclease subunit S n=1 Tax=Mycoplasma nasistruthionis TaxID=353852 RepID=UPI0023EA5AB6|nr:restriction endonuclease subunit S [Mycoplasma nasistruthionis]
MTSQTKNLIKEVKLADVIDINSSGLDKKIFEDEQEVYLANYMDVYKNKYIDKDFIFSITSGKEQQIKKANLLKGDILLTTSSETSEDICRTSVILNDLENTVFSYHLTRLRLKTPNLITSSYLSYLFDSEGFRRQQIYTKVYGSTRQTINKSEIEKLTLTIPSIQIQKQIVQILDKLSKMVEDSSGPLLEEIKLRQQQYEYYRDKLLNFKVVNKVSENQERERERAR